MRRKAIKKNAAGRQRMGHGHRGQQGMNKPRELIRERISEKERDREEWLGQREREIMGRRYLGEQISKK